MIALITENTHIISKLGTFVPDKKRSKDFLTYKNIEAFRTEWECLFNFLVVFVDYKKVEPEVMKKYKSDVNASYCVAILNEKELHDNFQFYLDLGFDEVISEKIHAYEINRNQFSKSSEKFSISSSTYKNIDDALSIYTNEIKCILDDKGVIIHVSFSALEILGYNKNELVGKNIFEFVVGKDLLGIFKTIGDVSGLEENKDYIFQFKHKEGNRVYLKVRFLKRIDETLGQNLVLFAQDVTSLIETQDKLKLSQIRWDSLTQNTPLTLCITDVNLVVNFINKLPKSVSGIDENIEDYIGQNVLNFVQESQVYEAENFIHQVLKKGYASNFEFVGGNRERIYSVTASIIENHEVKEGILFILEDITETIQIRDRLIREEIKNRRLFENNLSGMMRLNEFGEITECNFAMIRILGLNNPEVLIGIKVSELMSEEIMKVIEQSINEKRNFENVELDFSYNNCKYWLLLNISTIEVMGAKFVEIMAKDISLLKQKMEELKMQKNQSYKYQSMLLSSQLNPHFIFNALNSMQYYILHDDVEEGLNFVSDFSSLIRQVLQNSTRSLVSLQEEILFLKNYLTVEKHRLKGKLSYIFEVDDLLDVKNDAIPPMLIQPYVENTIVHGFSHKTDTGNIKLSFKSEEDYICCVIEDDGVGRMFSQKMNLKQTQDRKKSLSMSINSKRLELFEQQFDKRFKINVIDKLNDDKECEGTIVEIYIPYLNFH